MPPLPQSHTLASTETASSQRTLLAVTLQSGLSLRVTPQRQCSSSPGKLSLRAEGEAIPIAAEEIALSGKDHHSCCCEKIIMSFAIYEIHNIMGRNSEYRTVRMDKTDLEIIAYLQKDGRMAFTDIARALGVSEGTVRNRVARLTEDQIIQVVGMIDPNRLGYEAPAMIGVSVQPPLLEKVATSVATFHEVSYLIMVSGEFDLFVEVLCRDRGHLATFLNEKLLRVPGIIRTQTFITLRTYKMAYGAVPMLNSSNNEK